MKPMNINNYFDDANMNREQRRALEKAYRQWIATLPEELTPVSEDDSTIPYSSHPEDMLQVWRNKKFTVILWKVPAGHKITVERNEWDSKTRRHLDNITWDELMDIKRACGFGDRNAVEFYPPDNEVINIANVRHLWLLPREMTNDWLKLKIGE